MVGVGVRELPIASRVSMEELIVAADPCRNAAATAFGHF